MTVQLDPKLRKLFPVWSKLPSFSNFDKCEKQIIFKEIPGTICESCAKQDLAPS